MQVLCRYPWLQWVNEYHAMSLVSHDSIPEHSSPPSSPYSLSAPSSVITFPNSLHLRNFSLVKYFNVSRPLVISCNHCSHHASHLPLLFHRYTAVVMPVHYQHGTGQSSCRRVALMITAVWVLAFAVSCPLLFGFNTTGKSIASVSWTRKGHIIPGWLWVVPIPIFPTYSESTYHKA